MSKKLINNNIALSIRIQADGFCFCYHNSSNSKQPYQFHFYKVDLSHSLVANLNTALKEFNFEPNLPAKIIIADNRYTILPDERFKAEDATKILCFNYASLKPEDTIVLSNKLKKFSISLLFPVQKRFYNTMNKTFPNALYYSSTTLLLNYYSTIVKKNEQQMFVCFQERTMDIAAFSGEKPVYFNSFLIKEIQDATYYLLNVWKTLNFSQENDKLLLMNNQTIAPIQTQLKEFIAHIEQISVPLNDKLQSVNRSILPFDMQLLLCE